MSTVYRAVQPSLMSKNAVGLRCVWPGVELLWLGYGNGACASGFRGCGPGCAFLRASSAAMAACSSRRTNVSSRIYSASKAQVERRDDEKDRHKQ